MIPTRREFLQTTGGLLATACALPKALAAPTDGIPKRVLGKTGVVVPIIGLGTVAVGNLQSEKEAHALIHRAIDLGVTYIDTAPAFAGYGRAQAYLKPILKERRREVFIASKCLEPDGSKILALLHRNLKELGIEQLDLVYTHSIGHAVYDLDRLTADDGPIAMLEKAKKEGLARFVGITGHNRPEKFAAVIQRRDIDVMMNTVNIVDRHTYAFEHVVWPIARSKQIGLVAMKVYGGSIGVHPCKMPPDLRQASLRYALSVPGVALAVLGMGTIAELEQNVEWARHFEPMSPAEADALKEKTVALARQWGAHLDRLDRQGEKSRPLVNT
ncbi:MAG: hypothetical protein C4297_13255 [Gemmataceae bacterium]